MGLACQLEPSSLSFKVQTWDPVREFNLGWIFVRHRNNNITKHCDYDLKNIV
jgi:hypothetical protein